MTSSSISSLRNENPGVPLEEAASKWALKYGYVAVIAYKSEPGGDYTDVGCCSTDEEVEGYLNSPYCHEQKFIYDARGASYHVTQQTLQGGKCSICSGLVDATKPPFEGYFCPNCGRHFCSMCYQHKLPLTNGHEGFGVCTHCDCEVQGLFVGTYGKRPLHSLQELDGAPRKRQARELTTEELNAVLDRLLNRD